MRRSGHADLPLHGGRVPVWLADRMMRLGTAISESVLFHYGPSELLSRLSDPFWFQALGSVMGMDWHSSGITTSVVGALKRGLNPRAHELGIYICGGRGKHSRNTPDELRAVAEKTGLDGEALARTSRLTARIDNNAIADGFQIYLHAFVLTAGGEWAVIQQGLNDRAGLARRYHWHSATVRDFTCEPHTAIAGAHQGEIMNLVDSGAGAAQTALLEISHRRARCHSERFVAGNAHASRRARRRCGSETLRSCAGRCVRARPAGFRIAVAFGKAGPSHVAVARPDCGSGARSTNPILGPRALLLRSWREGWSSISSALEDVRRLTLSPSLSSRFCKNGR